MASRPDELVLRVTATQELLERQLREMGRNVDTFEQAAEQRIAQLEQRFSGINLRGAIDAVKDADQAFKSSFSSIQRQAEQIAQAVASSGTVDLTPLIEQSRNRVTMLNAETTAMQALLRAEEARLGPVERLSVQEKAALAAGRAAVTISREKAAAAQVEAQRLEELQAQLGQTAIAQQRMSQTSGAYRAGMQQAGFQVQDFAVQVAGGTSAIRAFSLQAPQLFGALQLMSSGAENANGKFATFARFLGGGWGVAIGIAIPFIGMLAERLLASGDAADTARTKVNALTEALDRLRRAQGQLDAVSQGAAMVEQKRLEGRRAILDGQIAAKQKQLRDLEALPGDIGVAGSATRRELEALQAQRDSDAGNLIVIQKTLQGYEAAQRARERAEAESRRSASGGARGGSSRGDAEARRMAAAAAREQAQAEREAAAARQALISATDGLISRYDPALAKSRQFVAEIDTLNRAVAAGLIDQQRANRIGMQVTLGYEIGGKDDPIDAMMDKMLEGRERMAQYARDNEDAARRLKVAWTDAAQGVVSQLQYLSNSIQSGGFLDIMAAALGLFEQLGGMGAFGKTVQSNILAGRRAAGGPVTAGKTYLVGERGPELFTPSSNGQIVSNDNLRAPRIPASDIAGAARSQTIVVQVQANDYFDARVDRRATGVAGPIGMRAAQAGAGLAQESMMRRSRNRIPGR